MFEFIAGKLAHATPSKAVVEVGGVGYGIVIALSTFSKLPQVGSSIHFFVSFIVREDAQLLYGFLTLPERDFFEKLNLVSGVGPKTALALLGHLDLADLQLALLHGNHLLLSKVPGIGKKTAERLVIDLRDKVQKMESAPATHKGERKAGPAGTVADAISALINLGYHPLEAQKAVKKAAEGKGEGVELGQLITASLRLM